MRYFMLFLYASSFTAAAHSPCESPPCQQTFSIPAAYAPWRETYYATHVSQEQPMPEKKKCPFCRSKEEDDCPRADILLRGTHCFVMMNEFPYTKGHILIAPYQHTGLLDELAPEVRAELMELAHYSIELIKTLFKCHGFNVGFNIGNFSGASIPDHIHMQVVPRYKGNLSFMHTIANSDVICYDIEKVYKTLVPPFKELEVTLYAE